MDLASDHLGSLLGTTGELFSSVPPSLALGRRERVFADLAAAREGLARIRHEAQGARSELDEVVRMPHGPGVRTALGEIHPLEREAYLAENELRLAGGRTAVLEASEDPAFAPEEVAAGEAEGAPETGPSDFTEEDLALLGSGLIPASLHRRRCGTRTRSTLSARWGASKEESRTPKGRRTRSSPVRLSIPKDGLEPTAHAWI
jgi:hypothetical protein